VDQKMNLCSLFVRNAHVVWMKFFSTYSDDIVSTCNLRSVVSDMFLFRWHYHECSLCSSS